MMHLFLVLGIPALIASALWLCTFAGARFAKRVKVRDVDMISIGVVQGALLGLLALLLGFSYSGAITHFAQRQSLLVEETNAAGTAWLRADILAPAQKVRMRQALSEYADARLALFHADGEDRLPQLERVGAAFNKAWGVAAEAAQARPELANVILPPLNDLSDALASQRAAHERHIPFMVLAVLIACACGSCAAVGFGLVNVERRTNLPGIVLVLLITSSLWLIIDMDYPKLGLIRVNDQPLVDFRASLK